MIVSDAATGVEHWRVTLDHVANEPIVAPDGTVYISSFSGCIHAYGVNGRELWRAPDDAPLAKTLYLHPCLLFRTL